MPLGILTDDQLNKELGKTVISNIEKAIEKSDKFEIVTPAKVVDIKRGRGNQLEIPNEIRALVAEEVISGARAKDVSKSFGISESSISAYKHDATSTASYDNPN